MIMYSLRSCPPRKLKPSGSEGHRSHGRPKWNGPVDRQLLLLMVQYDGVCLQTLWKKNE